MSRRGASRTAVLPWLPAVNYAMRALSPLVVLPEMTMSKPERSSSKISAGILAYRERADGLEVLLVHPGGPYWRNKDVGAWSIPKARSTSTKIQSAQPGGSSRKNSDGMPRSARWGRWARSASEGGSE